MDLANIALLEKVVIVPTDPAAPLVNVNIVVNDTMAGAGMIEARKQLRAADGRDLDTVAVAVIYVAMERARLEYIEMTKGRASVFTK